MLLSSKFLPFYSSRKGKEKEKSKIQHKKKKKTQTTHNNPKINFVLQVFQYKNILQVFIQGEDMTQKNHFLEKAIQLYSRDKIRWN